MHTNSPPFPSPEPSTYSTDKEFCSKEYKRCVGTGVSFLCVAPVFLWGGFVKSLLLIALLSVFLLGCVSQQPSASTPVPTAVPVVTQTPAATAAPATTATATATPTPAPTVAASSDARVIDLVATTNNGGKWEWKPSRIDTKLGERIKLRISVPAGDVEHGFTLPDFDINLKISPGETKEVELNADKAGIFNFFCSVFCGAGHREMRGTFAVSDK